MNIDLKFLCCSEEHQVPRRKSLEQLPNFVTNKQFLHTILLYYFHEKKSVSSSIQFLHRTYGSSVITKRKAKKWFKCFERGNYAFEYDGKCSDDDNDAEEEEELASKTAEKSSQEQSGASPNSLSDFEEFEIIVKFVKHCKENYDTCSESKKIMCKSLLCYYNIKKNNKHAARSKEYLLLWYSSVTLAMIKCNEWLKQHKNSIVFEYEEESPQIPNTFEISLETHEEEGEEAEKKTIPPIYFSRCSKIEKILVPSPKKMFLRKIILHFYFDASCTPHDCYLNLFKLYGDQALSAKTCTKWFMQFDRGNFNLNDKKRTGRAKKVKEEELNAILNVKSRKSQKEIADILSVSQQTISRHLKKRKQIIMNE